MFNIELNTDQQAMFTIIQTAQQRAFENVKHSALHYVNSRLNADLDFDYAQGKISLEEYTNSLKHATPEQLAEALQTMELPMERIRDFHTVGFQLPQRSGSTVMAQIVLMDFMKNYPEARCLYLGTREPELFDVSASDCNCDAILFKGSAGYGRACKQIVENTEHSPNFFLEHATQPPKPYSLVVFDCSNYLRGRDTRFEQLLRAVHSPTVSPPQFFVHFSS